MPPQMNASEYWDNMAVGKCSRQMQIVALITALAGLYVSWQLVGLRFTNHDDIFYHLHSWVFANDYIDFSQHTAARQARLQAYINMPITLWMNHLGNAWIADAIGIGVFGIMYAGLIWMLAEISNVKSALAIAAFTLFMFPLHYYFMIPQAYSVMGVWGLAFAFIATALLSSHLREPTLTKLWLSAILFTTSLWGPEYNIILHPLLLLAATASSGSLFHKKTLKTSIPFVVGWALTVAIYGAYSLIYRQAGGDSYGRVSFGFDIVGWIKTYFTLTTKAFVPLALWNGVTLTSASAQGGPEIPVMLTYQTLFQATQYTATAFTIFTTFFIIAASALYLQKLKSKSILFCAAICTVLGTVPCFILAASAHYQYIVAMGYLQGHLASFYVQLGLSGLTFLAAAYTYNSIQQHLKLPVLAVMSCTLAFFMTMTLIYNTVNRQVMMANAQKWEAFQNIVHYIQSTQPELKNDVYLAPGFWTSSGVSAIPDVSVYTGTNYWSEYSKSVLNYPLQFVPDTPPLTKHVIVANYFALPQGTPVAVMSEQLNNTRWKSTFISSKQVSANVFYDVGVEHQGFDLTGKWTCADVCVSSFESDPSFHPATLMITSRETSARNLLTQFLLPRHQQFSQPFIISALRIENFKVAAWGPQTAKAGDVPNPQPNNRAGVWIKFDNQDQLTGVKIMLDGVPATSINIQPGLMTAAFPSSLFMSAGKRKLEISQQAGYSRLEVGNIKIEQ
ncbi:hypothetical protein [Pseudomonas sp. TE3610]